MASSLRVELLRLAALITCLEHGGLLTRTECTLQPPVLGRPPCWASHLTAHECQSFPVSGEPAVWKGSKDSESLRRSGVEKRMFRETMCLSSPSKRPQAYRERNARFFHGLYHVALLTAPCAGRWRRTGPYYRLQRKTWWGRRTKAGPSQVVSGTMCDRKPRLPDTKTLSTERCRFQGWKFC